MYLPTFMSVQTEALDNGNKPCSTLAKRIKTAAVSIVSVHEMSPCTRRKHTTSIIEHFLREKKKIVI